MEEKRDFFTIYRSFYECLAMADNETRLQMYDIIMNYGFNHEEPTNLAGVPGMLWKLIKPNLDKSWTNSKNGKKGGRPKKQDQIKAETKPNDNPKETQLKPKRNRTQSNKDIDKDKEDKDKDKDTTATAVMQSAAVAAAENKSLDERKKEFRDSLIPYEDIYGKEMISEFFNYYSESDRGEVMRFESDRYWNAERVLSKWKKNQREYSKTHSDDDMLRNSSERVYKQEW